LDAPIAPRYTAFLSYSHRAARVAERLHRQLESFRIDRDLVGRATDIGPIPATLHPIVRDRAEFDAGGSLVAQSPNLVLAKLVARLVGLTTDQVFRRAERERRRQARLRIAVASVMAVPALGGGIAAWHAMRSDRSLAQANKEITDAKSLAAQLLGINPARAATPGALENLTKAITAISQNSATDARYAKALDLLKAGNTNEAAAELEIVAREAKASVVRDQKRAAAAYRNLGAIAGIAEPKKARTAYAEAARLDLEDIDGTFWHASFEAEAGNLEAAEDAYRRAITLGAPGKDDEALYWVQIGLGDIRVAHGNLDAARAEYKKARGTAEQSLKSDPNNTAWQRNLAVADGYVGDVLVRQGNLPAALQSYRDSRTIADRLAKSDPKMPAGSTIWRYLTKGSSISRRGGGTRGQPVTHGGTGTTSWSV
jgi:tetratricopeptide (TPR) repeat protein